MTRLNPPAYNDVETRRISTSDVANLFAALSITTPISAGPPASLAANAPNTQSPEEPARLYSFESETNSGLTEAWDQAAFETQGVPNASPHRLTPKLKKHTKKGGFAIFHGVLPGVRERWNETKPLVIGVPGSLFQGYPTLKLARGAFEYARERGWTRTCMPNNPATSRGVVTSTLTSLPVPIGLLESPNPLHAGAANDGRWYIVYCGITPGVYQSRRVPFAALSLCLLTALQSRVQS
ncbi:hypothetical protein C8R43DRAFT_1138101 [Mycena crocata]|nr:hypothetical protein C8R43DRAFT_1138101 [Mycena crocata]